MKGFAPPEVYRALDSRFSEGLESARALMRQPSVSATGEGIAECAEMVRKMMADAGFTTRLWSQGGHPLVIGELDVGAPVTLIEYEMYDVQPVGDLDAWKSPPFSADLREMPGVGTCVVARGAANSKGALANHLFTWKTIRDVDEMPVNVTILAEGEEEISSANFIEYVRTHRRDLRADAAIADDYSEDLRGVPTIYLGVKGCLYLTLWSRGNRAAGGPMEAEIHSSDAAWVASPAWRLVQALNTLVDSDQRPSIDGIWQDVRRPSKVEVAMVRRLAKTFDPQAWLEEGRVAKFKYNLPKSELLLRYLYEPTVNICGIHGGYVEHGGTKTVLPHEAYAKVDIRLVKDMTVAGTLRKLRAHLERRGFGDLRIEVHGPYGPARSSPDSWIARAAIDVAETHGKAPEVWPSSGGTMPAFAFEEHLRIPWVSTGLGHGAHAHAPNEYASIDGMRRFMAGEASLVYAAASRAGKAPK
jgi:acetylornithine deacetylase/succinyl-diaminopimelate desuccinylase-like protein